jgi:Fe-S oxidoreductase
MSPVPAKVLSLVMDILGMGLLAGTLFFLINRIKSIDLRGPKKTIVPMCLLLIILITGFMAEGSRLSITNHHIPWETPFGLLFSPLLPGTPLFMQFMIRIHFFFVLLLMALLPFTHFRHLIITPFNVLFKRKTLQGQLNRKPLNLKQIGAETYKDFSWKQLLDAESCVSCGRCEENCPAFISGKPLSPRKIIQDIREQMESRSLSPLMGSHITPAEIWSCTTCMACLEHCPVYIEPMDKIIDIRVNQTLGKGKPPEEAGALIRNLELFGDADGKGTALRMDWAFNQDVPFFHSDGLNPEVLLWVGCLGAFHPRYVEVSRSLAFILKKAGVPFGILGKEEMCCGDPARRLGEERLFIELAQKNIQCFKKYNVKKILTLCPHCLNTLKNEYPLIEEDSINGGTMGMKVIHADEYISDLIRDKRILPKYPVHKKIAIHDPCYLGRGNRIFEPPREIIKAIPEAKLRELKHHREQGFCCGGGGGGMWLHEYSGRRMNVIRAEEVMESGADILGTACPYCLIMLEDGIKSLESSKPTKALDIIEIVAAAI